MAAEDIAGAITYIVTRPREVAVNEALIRPTEQERLTQRPSRRPTPSGTLRPSSGGADQSL
jgi:hypothetical protein